jgi:hypothetical protein
MNRKPYQLDSQRRASELIGQIYDSITKLVEAGETGPRRVRIKRRRLEDILSLDGSDLSEQIIRQKGEGIQILDGFMIPKVPPSLPISVPTVKEDSKIPEPPGFVIEKI